MRQATGTLSNASIEYIFELEQSNIGRYTHISRVSIAFKINCLYINDSKKLVIPSSNMKMI